MIGENLVKIHVIESKIVSLFSVPEAKKKKGIKKRKYVLYAQTVLFSLQ